MPESTRLEERLLKEIRKTFRTAFASSISSSEAALRDDTMELVVRSFELKPFYIPVIDAPTYIMHDEHEDYRMVPIHQRTKFILRVDCENGMQYVVQPAVPHIKHEGTLCCDKDHIGSNMLYTGMDLGEEGMLFCGLCRTPYFSGTVVNMESRMRWGS